MRSCRSPSNGGYPPRYADTTVQYAAPGVPR